MVARRRLKITLYVLNCLFLIFPHFSRLSKSYVNSVFGNSIFICEGFISKVASDGLVC